MGVALSGNLIFLVGGVKDEFPDADELLSCMDSSMESCGVVGTGQAAKICNNILLTIATVEAMNFGIR